MVPISQPLTLNLNGAFDTLCFEPEIRTTFIKSCSLALDPWASLLRIDRAEASHVGGAGDKRLPVRGDEVLAAPV